MCKWIHVTQAFTTLTEQCIAKIDKLRIQGVRSFSNRNGEVIEFSTPLTLIVGYNGSGKTTIIECLKYATTGDLPPNSKGGAFVHDPNLAGEKEVMGQVKLAFKGTNQSKMVITRSMQLTVKKTTRTFKTLDGNLVTYKGGERSSLSTRVAELDTLMPYHLGVSKAVLDLVIFCHQDESLWPMSEPGSLKKKFDEIFEALKYTKALDNIKSIKKSQGNALKTLKEKEQSTKRIKSLGDKAESQSRELHAEVTQLKAEIRELEVKAKIAQDEWHAAANQAANFTHVVMTLRRKREHAANLEGFGKTLSNDLVERNESDEWLQSEVDQFEQRLTAHEKRRVEQKNIYDSLGRTIDQGRETLQKKYAEAGKHEEQKTAHERQIKEHKAEIKNGSRRHNIQGFDGDLDDMQIHEYIERITKLSKDQNAAVEKVRRETEREMQKAQKVLGDLGERRSALNESKNSAKQQVASNDSRIAACQPDLNKIEIDEGGKAALENSIEDLEARFKKAKAEFKAASWERKTQDGNFQLNALTEETKRLNRDLSRAVVQLGDLTRLDLLKQRLENNQRSLDKMKGVHTDRLQALLDKHWQPSGIELSFQRAFDRKVYEVKEAKRERDLEFRNLEQIDYKLVSVRAHLKKGHAELEECTKRLHENVEGEPKDFETTVAELQSDRDTVKSDLDGFAHKLDFYKNAAKKASEENKCNMCLRGFHGTPEQQKFLDRVQKIIDKDSLEDLQKDLKDCEESLRKAKEAGPSHDTWVRLTTTELPRLEHEKRELEKERKKAHEKTEDHQVTVDNREEAKSELDTLSKPVASIVKYSQEVLTTTQEIQELSAKSKESGTSRTPGDIHKELELASTKYQSTRDTIDTWTRDKERARLQISDLELNLSNCRNNLSTASHQLEKKAGISQQIGDLKSSNQTHRETIQRLDGRLRDLAPQIAEEEAKRDDIKQRGLDKEDNLQSEASKLSESVNKLKLAEQRIRAYIEEDGAAKLARCQREVETVQQEIQQTEAEQKLMVVKVNKISEELRDHTATKKTIQDNIRYRKNLKELEAVRDEIRMLSGQNAEADQEQWNRQSSRWETKYNELSTEITSKFGAARAKDDQLEKLIADWETEYKDAAKEFKFAHIEVEATKAAVEDLGRYGGALDKAIIKYHSIKMEEVNRIVDELWKKTYQGTDVDTILIRSDDENAKGNRSYNYRVCMIKQDAEMDMRGRCSAGQKVLASIIIRLALAECFGVNCGLIALDEPTTNLDHDNIRSLAGSLHDIIQARRHQANFQLIVITHDEEFLKFMKCPDFTDTYYRVSRNDEQKSIIERQSIAEVM